LPESSATEPRVDLACREALDTSHDFVERPNLIAIQINQERKDKVDVIGHYHGHVEVVLGSVSVTTAVQYNCPRPIGQDNAVPRDECDEVSRIILLNMRQIAAVEAHGSIVDPVLTNLTRKSTCVSIRDKLVSGRT
jgi:hypothetical protein